MSSIKKRVVTPKEVKVMKFLRKEGYPNTKIGSFLGYNESTVRRAVTK